MKNEVSGHIKKLVLKNKVFMGLLLLQALILFLLFINLFCERTKMLFDASNFEIADEKVISNQDNSIYITGKNDTEPFGRWIAGTEPFDVRGGMYEVSIKYQSRLSDVKELADYENITGALELFREEPTDNICYNAIILTEGDTYRTTRMWVRNYSGEKGLQIKINFFGTGELKIDSIMIQELTMWRFMRFLAWIIGCIAFDSMVFYFFLYDNAQHKLKNTMLIVTIFFVSLPMFTDMLFDGHDMNFHLTRILTLAKSLSAGNILEPIQTQMLNGYGYATPLFYGQLFLYFPALLYNLAVPMQICYQIYAITVNIATCLIAYYSFKGIAKDNRIAATGAAAYTLSIYRFTNQMVRAAVGEYTAMAFFPLVTYGFFRVYTKKEDTIGIKDYLPIVLGLSGIIQSHVLSCELTAIFILAVCIINFKKTIAVRRFIALAKAAAATLLINLGFLLPFLDSMTMDVQVKSAPVNRIQLHGTYLVQVFAPFQLGFGGSIEGMRDEMSYALGLSLTAGVTIFLICYIMQKEWNIEKNSLFIAGIQCAILTMVCILLSLRFFPWDSIQGYSEPLARIFCMIQFPWRYLAPATVFATMATVIGLVAVKESKGRQTAYALCMAICIIAVITGGFYMNIYTNGTDTISVFGDSDVNIEIGKDEYLLKDTVKGELNQREVSFDRNVIMVSDYQYENGVTTFGCKNTADVEKPVELPLLNYDNYYAYDVDTGEEIGIMNGTNNRVSLAVPAHFDSDIRVFYKIPVIWKVAYVISAVSVIFVVAAAVRNRRKERLN